MNGLKTDSRTKPQQDKGKGPGATSTRAFLHPISTFSEPTASVTYATLYVTFFSQPEFCNFLLTFSDNPVFHRRLSSTLRPGPRFDCTWPESIWKSSISPA